MFYRALDYFGVMAYYLQFVTGTIFVFRVLFDISIQVSQYAAFKLSEYELSSRQDSSICVAQTNMQFSKPNFFTQINSYIMQPVAAWFMAIINFLLISAFVEEYLKSKGYDTSRFFEPEIIARIQQDSIELLTHHKQELSSNAKVQIKSVFYTTPREFSLYYLACQANAYNTQNIIMACQKGLDPFFATYAKLSNIYKIPTDVAANVLTFLTLKDLLAMYDCDYIKLFGYKIRLKGINMPDTLCKKIFNSNDYKDLKVPYLSFLKKSQIKNTQPQTTSLSNDQESIRLSYLV